MLKKIILNKFDTWLFESYKIKPENQSIFRIIYASFILFISGIPNWYHISKTSDGLFLPPRFSVAYFFNDFLSQNTFLILGLALGVLYVSLLFGYRTKIVSILITIIYIFGNSFEYSRGKIDHVDLLIIITPLIMAFSNWGDCYSTDSYKNDTEIKSINNLPVVLLSLLIGFAFFTAGIPKIYSGWLSTETHAVKGYLFIYHYTLGYNEYLSQYLIKINNDHFWELFDYIAVIFEVSFLIAVFKPALFRFYILISICFHLLNLLILNISFYYNLAVYALYLDYDIFKQFITVGNLNLSKIFNHKIMGLMIIFQIFIYLGLRTSPIQYICKTTGFDHLQVLLLSMAIAIGLINLYFSMKIKYFTQ